jgi:hypothetical protein
MAAAAGYREQLAGVATRFQARQRGPMSYGSLSGPTLRTISMGDAEKEGGP